MHMYGYLSGYGGAVDIADSYDGGFAEGYAGGLGYNDVPCDCEFVLWSLAMLTLFIFGQLPSMNMNSDPNASTEMNDRV